MLLKIFAKSHRDFAHHGSASLSRDRARTMAARPPSVFKSIYFALKFIEIATVSTAHILTLLFSE